MPARPSNEGVYPHPFDACQQAKRQARTKGKPAYVYHLGGDKRLVTMVTQEHRVPLYKALPHGSLVGPEDQPVVYPEQPDYTGIEEYAWIDYKPVEE